MGYEETIEEALEDVLKYFLQMVDENYPKKDYPHGIPEEDFDYSDSWTIF